MRIMIYSFLEMRNGVWQLKIGFWTAVHYPKIVCDIKVI